MIWLLPLFFPHLPQVSSTGGKLELRKRDNLLTGKGGRGGGGAKPYDGKKAFSPINYTDIFFNSQ